MKLLYVSVFPPYLMTIVKLKWHLTLGFRSTCFSDLYWNKVENPDKGFCKTKMEEMEIDLIVMSSRLPMGVATRYRPPCNSPCKIKGSGIKTNSTTV
jgi:hypothetical protein